MATIRFGLACDAPGCAVAFNDYGPGTIRNCEDCLRDLCPECAAASGHVQGREDDEQYGTWRETERMPIADAIADAETLRLNDSRFDWMGLAAHAIKFGADKTAHEVAVEDARDAFYNVPGLR